MFDLSTAPTNESINTEVKHFSGVILNDHGLLEPFHYVISGAYYHDVNTQREYDSLIELYNNKIVVIRNYSKFKTLETNLLETEAFRVECENPVIDHRIAFENKWGSIRECMKLSLRNEIYTRVYDAKRPLPDMEVDVLPFDYPDKCIPVHFTILTDKGIETINGIIRHTFHEDRTENCPTCVNGFIKYEEALNKIGNLMVSGTSKARFSGAFLHDLDLSDDRAITNSLYEAFRQVIELARIKTITFERIQ